MYISKLDFEYLANKYGTPLYVYELDQVTNRYNQITQAINYPNLKIHYAMKANFNPGIMKHVKSLGAGIDAVSPGEVIYAQKFGFDASDIIFTANNLTNAEIKEVKEQGVLLNLGSLSELKRYADMFPGTEVCLRFNPNVIAGSHINIQTGGPTSKFGLLLDHAEQALEICNEHQLKIVGLHKHTGSGIENLDLYFQAVDNLVGLINPSRFPDLNFVDFGGGLFVPYEPDKKEIDYIDYAEKLNRRIEKLNKLYDKQLDLYLEPGKFLVAESGNLVVTANTLKNNHGHIIVGTDSGFNHLIRPVMYDAYHHVSNISNPNAKEFTYDITGNICETGDNFATARKISEIREGDTLVIHTAGAYGFAQACEFNLRPLPPELTVYQSQETLVRERSTNHDYINNLMDRYQND